MSALPYRVSGHRFFTVFLKTDHSVVLTGLLVEHFVTGINERGVPEWTFESTVQCLQSC